MPKLVEVKSLINARDVRGEAQELVVEDLLAEIPESDAQLAALEARVLASPTYRDLLISRDGTFTLIAIETEAYSSFGEGDVLAGFDQACGAGSASARKPARRFLSGEENREIVEAVRAVVARHAAPGFEIYAAGTPFMVTRITELMQQDMVRFVALSLLSISVLLYFLFGSWAGVLLPLLVVVSSLVALLGLFPLTGQRITPPAQILPTFQLTVGVAYPVHFLSIFFKAAARGRVARRRGGALARPLGPADRDDGAHDDGRHGLVRDRVAPAARDARIPRAGRRRARGGVQPGAAAGPRDGDPAPRRNARPHARRGTRASTACCSRAAASRCAIASR